MQLQRFGNSLEASIKSLLKLLLLFPKALETQVFVHTLLVSLRL